MKLKIESRNSNSLGDVRATAIDNQISEVLTKMKLLVDSDPIIGETSLKTLSLIIELGELRDRRMSLFTEQLIRAEAELSESNQKLLETETRIMELEAIPLTNNIALQFIRERGLYDQFSAFVEELVNEAFEDVSGS